MQMDMTQSWLSYHITSGHGIPCSMVFFTIAIFCKIILYSLVVFTNRLDALTVHISFFGVLGFWFFYFCYLSSKELITLSRCSWLIATINLK